MNLALLIETLLLALTVAVSYASMRHSLVAAPVLVRVRKQ